MIVTRITITYNPEHMVMEDPDLDVPATLDAYEHDLRRDLTRAFPHASIALRRQPSLDASAYDIALDPDDDPVLRQDVENAIREIDSDIYEDDSFWCYY